MATDAGLSVRIADCVARIVETPLAAYGLEAPWRLTQAIEEKIGAIVAALPPTWRIEGGVARHPTATVEPGAVLKPPVILGPASFVAATAYLRGGVFLDEDVIVGPACEIKSSVLFRAAKAAHLSFIGDSVIGAGANIEAGAMIANYRNETSGDPIRFYFEGRLIETGVTKFGALVGDRARIGANAVIAPGAVLMPGSVTPRLSLVDQSVHLGP